MTPPRPPSFKKRLFGSPTAFQRRFNSFFGSLRSIILRGTAPVNHIVPTGLQGLRPDSLHTSGDSANIPRSGDTDALSLGAGTFGVPATPAPTIVAEGNDDHLNDPSAILSQGIDCQGAACPYLALYEQDMRPIQRIHYYQFEALSQLLRNARQHVLLFSTYIQLITSDDDTHTFDILSQVEQQYAEDPLLDFVQLTAYLGMDQEWALGWDAMLFHD